MPQDWSASDCKSFMTSVADAVEGSAAVLAPLTRDRVGALVSERVALRDAAITKDLLLLRSELLNVDPLSPCPYGSLGGKAAILRSRPPSARMVLEKGALSDLLRRQSSTFPKGDSNSRSSSSKKFQGNRGGQSSRKSSPRRSGQQLGSGKDHRQLQSS